MYVLQQVFQVLVTVHVYIISHVILTAQNDNVLLHLRQSNCYT